MHLKTVEELTGWQDIASQWDSNPIIHHNGRPVGLCRSCGPNARTPDGSPDQTNVHPRHSLYQFDTKKFLGPKYLDLLILTIKLSCIGCTLFLQQKNTNKHTYQLHCNHYPTQHASTVRF